MNIRSVLYITTQITGNARYLSWSCYPDIWYARLQEKILNLGEQNSKINFFAKPYPKDFVKNPNGLYYESSSKILHDTLVDILMARKFDLIITEASATTLLEVLCTQSQIISLFSKDYMRLSPKAQKMLETRIFIAEDEENYIQMVQKALLTGFIENPKPLNDEFLKTYGLGDIGIDPYLCAVKSLEDIVEVSNSKG